jgi:hypothetical protein
MNLDRMTPDEYRRYLARLQLTQQEAGEFFGASARTGQRWAINGPPLAVAMLLRAGLGLRALKHLRLERPKTPPAGADGASNDP